MAKKKCVCVRGGGGGGGGGGHMNFHAASRGGREGHI